MAEELSRVLGLRGTYPKAGSLIDRLTDIKGALKSLLTSLDDAKRRPASVQKDSARTFNAMQSLKGDARFSSSFLSVSALETLYRDFFKSGAEVEVKSRCFKDLYNLIEEAALRFYELYVDCAATKQKNTKLEETFQQLD